MLTTILSILPIFLLIALGLGLRKGGIPSADFWQMNDKLVYWVLMPCLIFNKISLTNFTQLELGPFAFTVLGGLVAALVYSWTAAKAANLTPQANTSILQGCVRHNSFLVLALATSLFGPEGLQIAVLCTALAVPVTNILVVSSMVTMLQRNNSRSLILAIIKDLLRNPLIISITFGLLANVMIDNEIPVIHEFTRILGQGALPITLLSVGASLRIKVMSASIFPLALAFSGKMLIFPAVVFALGSYFDLPKDMFQVAILYALVPTGAAAYTLSVQMKGDAPLMAAIVTLQTLASLVTIPLSLYFLLPLM